MKQLKYLCLIILLVICISLFIVIIDKRVRNFVISAQKDTTGGKSANTHRPDMGVGSTHNKKELLPSPDNILINTGENVGAEKRDYDFYNEYKKLFFAKHDFEKNIDYYHSIRKQSEDFAKRIWASPDTFFYYLDLFCNDSYDVQEKMWRELANEHAINNLFLRNEKFLSQLIEKGLNSDSSFVRELVVTLLSYHSKEEPPNPVLSESSLKEIMNAVSRETVHPVLSALMQTLSIYQKTNSAVNELFYKFAMQNVSNRYDLQTELQIGYAYKYLTPGAFIAEEDMVVFFSQKIYDMNETTKDNMDSAYMTLQSIWFKKFLNQPENKNEKSEVLFILDELMNNDIDIFEDFFSSWTELQTTNKIANYLEKYSQEQLSGFTQNRIAIYIHDKWSDNPELRKTYLTILLNILEINNKNYSNDQTGTHPTFQTINSLSGKDWQEMEFTNDEYAKIITTVNEIYTPWPATQRLKEQILDEINKRK